jgi:hypothetical protein
MIARPCSEELVRKALNLGASKAHCDGAKLIVFWDRDKEPPCSLKCLVMQTMGEIVRKR